MKNKIVWLLICLLLPPMVGRAYVTLQSYSTGETLTAAKLNSNQNAINTGMDALQAEYRDSIDALRAELNDSINVRNRTVILLPFADASGDSFYAGDSLKVEINRRTPIGNAACLRVTEETGVIEKIKLFWDVDLPNSLAKLDSIRGSVWSVNTNGTDHLSLYVYDDSTRYDYKAACDSTGKQYSGSTKTLKVFSQAVAQTIVGGRIRVEAVIQMTNSDSMFVGPIELITTNR